VSEIIEDGTGDGYKLQINQFNRAATQAVTSTALSKIGLDGGGWTVSTGSITLTSANESTLAYVKNTGTDSLILRDLVVRSDKSNESTGTLNTKQTYTVKIKAVIVAEDLSTAITPISLRSSKEKSLSLTIEKGVEGSSSTAGATIATYLVQCGTSLEVASGEGYFFLEPNASIAITVTPPSGNTSLTIAMGATIYKEDGSL